MLRRETLYRPGKGKRNLDTRGIPIVNAEPTRGAGQSCLLPRLRRGSVSKARQGWALGGGRGRETNCVRRRTQQPPTASRAHSPQTSGRGLGGVVWGGTKCGGKNRLSLSACCCFFATDLRLPKSCYPIQGKGLGSPQGRTGSGSVSQRGWSEGPGGGGRVNESPPRWTQCS